MQLVDIPVKVDSSFIVQAGSEMPLDKRMKVWAAISLYLERKISIGRAAELAEMGSGDFQDYLVQHEIPVSLITFKELQEELSMLKETGRIQ
jgi:predicted HTH domain antitoxin